MRKHINFYTLAASCLLVFAACTNSKLDIETESDYFYNDDPAAASLVAVTQSDLQEDAETKSMLSSNGNNPDVLWTSGDQISVLQFQGDEYVNIPFTTTADKKTSASFTEDETGSYDREQTSVSYAVYPYSSDTKISVVDETVTITTEIPTTQFITENTFAEEANIAVGKVEGGNVNFKNACAYLRFQASNGGRVKSLTISGKNGEYIAGKVNITFDGDGNPVAKAIEGVSSKTVTLTCPEGTDAFAAGKPYYVAVIPDVFENGVVLTVETVNDNLTVGSTDISYTRTLTRTSKNTRMTLTRNTVKRFPYWDDKFEWRSAMLFDCENSADGYCVKKTSTDLIKELGSECTYYQVISNPYKTVQNGSEKVLMFDATTAADGNYTKAEGVQNARFAVTATSTTKDYWLKNFYGVRMKVYISEENATKYYPRMQVSQNSAKKTDETTINRPIITPRFLNGVELDVMALHYGDNSNTSEQFGNIVGTDNVISQEWLNKWASAVKFNDWNDLFYDWRDLTGGSLSNSMIRIHPFFPADPKNPKAYHPSEYGTIYIDDIEFVDLIAR